MSNPPQDNQPQWGTPDEGGPRSDGERPFVGQNPSKYGTEAYDPHAFGGPVEEPDKFRKLKLFTLVSLGIYAINQVIGFVLMNSTGYRNEMIEDIEQQMSAAGQTMDRSQVESYIDAVAGVSLIFAVIGLGIYLLVYFGLRAAKNWARIVGIVFAILGAVFGIGGFVFGGPTDLVTVVVTLLWIGVNVYWLVLAFSPVVADYLKQVKR